MTTSYLARAYWGCRRESAEACAARAELFFRLLAECHPSYARWYEQARSPQKALQRPFEPTRATFVRFFGEKKYRQWEDGFAFSAWTGHGDQTEGGVVRLRCGGDAQVAPNSVLLAFPREAPGQERMLTGAVVARVMRALARAWTPDWALATTDELEEQLSRRGEADTFVGWMTYISRPCGDLPPLPEPVRVEPVDDRGSLILLTPERLSATEPEHLALGHHVQGLLEARGILGRLSRE